MNDTASSSGGGGGSMPVIPYAFRRRLHVQAQASAIPSDYSIAVPLDHWSLTGQSKALLTGNDVRIFRDDGGMLTELDRVLDPVSSWNGTSTLGGSARRLRSRLRPSTNPIDLLRRSDRCKTSCGWESSVTLSERLRRRRGGQWWLYAVADWWRQRAAAEAGSALTLSVSSGDIWASSDSFVFLHHDVSGDFVADTYVTSMGGAMDEWSKMGV
ncbi:MAG: hypothetical protein IPM54_35085 [Polyangiaceae bacterium]|nr:hypothetical protein [Polyangiaceae bacterium]